MASKAELDQLMDDLLILHEALGREWLAWYVGKSDEPDFERAPRPAYDRLIAWAKNRARKVRG